jgi:hypothetical protein
MTDTLVRLEEKKLKRSNIPSPRELYVRGCSVYRVLAYNETDKKVLFCTTNDVIENFGQIRKIDMRRKGFYFCPLNLQEAAVQVFELDEKYTSSTLEKLTRHRQDNLIVFDYLGLDYIMEDMIRSMTRLYTPPLEQVEQFPELKGKVFEVLVPFYCLTRQEYKSRIYRSKHPGLNDYYYNGMKYNKWPVWYVSPHFI